ncbi:MAG: Ca2+:H+ antiporter [Solirubrobacteraceae bacterium]|jgi:Ca2+:H+ antiporter|nr:Ca2+:H+ antiporter [Solirubrobacteraceae bacterium]
MAALRRLNLGGSGWPYLLVPFIPVAIVLDAADASPVAILFASALGVVPTAALMGRATEELAERSGPGIGGLLNVTFGNAPELIIALVALGAGLHEVVKASLVGSILGNILLVLGAAMVAGGAGRDRQRFDRTAASAQSSMLLLAAMAFVLPAVYVLVQHGGLPQPSAQLVGYGSKVEDLSLAIAIVLALTYGAALLFSLRTHRALFNPVNEEGGSLGREPWSVRRSIGVLALAGVAVGGMSEILVHSISAAARSIGLTQFFIGAVVVAIVGNAAEHWVAVLVARKDKMDLAVNIAIGSSAQIALFVVPVLIIGSFAIGPRPMPLVLNGFELGAVLLAVLIANQVTSEGESTWFEGVVLLATYVVLALAFAFA